MRRVRRPAGPAKRLRGWRSSASSLGGHEGFAARNEAKTRTPAGGVVAKLPYAGVNRIRFEGTVSIRERLAPADTPASPTIRPRAPRRRQRGRRRPSEGQGHAGDGSAEALVEPDGAVGTVLAHIELEPVVARIQAEVVGEAVFNQCVGAAQVAGVVVEVAPVRIQVLALDDEAPALVLGVEAQPYADDRRG